MRVEVLAVQVSDMVDVAAQARLPTTLVGAATTIVLIVVLTAVEAEKEAEAGRLVVTMRPARVPSRTSPRRMPFIPGSPLGSGARWTGAASPPAVRGLRRAGRR